jgi:trigger factor
MQVSIETTGGLERRMTIVVPSDSFEEQITQRLKDAAQRARLDGFRAGKVPLKEIRRRFGRSVRQEVAGELMQHSFFEAVQQEEVAPAASPSLEILNMSPGDDFEFTATFEVFPQIGLADFAVIEISRPTAQITGTDIDAMVDKLREQRKSWEPVERGVQVGDQITVDFVGTLEGEAFEGGNGEDVTFAVGQEQMIEDFDQAVLGVIPGESTEFDATFPDDYQAENLQGKTVHFEVTVKEAGEPRIPELDEEFFEAFGVSEGGLGAFRSEIEDNMTRELTAAVRSQVKRQVLDALEQTHEVPLPAAMVAREITGLREQMMQQMAQYAQGNEVPQFPDDMFDDEARRRVTVGLIVNEIIRTASLEADPDRVRERIEELAKPYGQPEQVINWYYSNEQQLNQVQMAVLEDQVVDHVLECAQVEELESSYEDIVAGRVLHDDHDHEHADGVGDESQSGSV